MGWGTSWDKPIVGFDVGSGDKTVAVVVEGGKVISFKEGSEAEELIKLAYPEAINKIPTHDPYTNPGAFLYYECQCGAVLDPKVKSFASLNNHANNAGWKVRWGEKHYVPYCPKCVVEKGIE